MVIKRGTKIEDDCYSLKSRHETYPYINKERVGEWYYDEGIIR
jgi:hypothetical protein